MLFQITSCLPRGMCAMIVQDNSNPLIFMVFFIEDLQEVNEICALVSFPNKRDNFTCYQIHACQQRNSSMPLIFTISANKTMFHRCLLYTSDAADDLLCVDLGGRRIIKKKK